MNTEGARRSPFTDFIHDCSSKLALHQFIKQFQQQFDHTIDKLISVTLGDDSDIQTVDEEANRIVHSAISPFTKPVKSKTMRIVYGIVGEGMGHSTRSKVTLEFLMKEQHHVKVLVSNRAYKFLHESFSDRFPRCAAAKEDEAAIDIIEIEGFTIQYVNNVFDGKASLLHTIQRLPTMLSRNIGAYYHNLVCLEPHAVISDFESFAYMFAKAHGLPNLSIDNQHVVQQCFIPDAAREVDHAAFLSYKGFVKAKLPSCNYYIITGFFTPEIRDKYKGKAALVPPILRQAILDAKPFPAEQGDYFLVYQTSKSDTSLVSTLQDFSEKCVVYGLDREETIGNLELKRFSEQGFIDDLAHARGVIANGGLSLMNEAISLQRPFFSVPVENQYEQVINGWYLQELGYGIFTDRIEVHALRQWAKNIPQYSKALSSCHHDSNTQLYKTVKRLLVEFRTQLIWWEPSENVE